MTEWLIAGNSAFDQLNRASTALRDANSDKALSTACVDMHAAVIKIDAYLPAPAVSANRALQAVVKDWHRATELCMRAIRLDDSDVMAESLRAFEQGSAHMEDWNAAVQRFL